MGCGLACAPNFGCVRGTKPSFFTFARENSGVQPLTMVDKSMSAVHALCLLLLRLQIIDIDVKDTKKKDGNKKLVSGMDVVLRLGRLNDSMAILNDEVWASVMTFD